MSSNSEGGVIADAKAGEVAELSWEELDDYGERLDVVTGPSGRTYRVKSRAFWDMDEWASGMNIEVKVYAPSGPRRIFGHKA